MPEHDNTAPSPATMTTLDKQETNERLVGDYVLLSKIGQGSFATVDLFQCITGQVVAIKAVLRNKLTKKLQVNLESEINILKTVHHPHIVGLIECQKTEGHIYLVMEYCSMGDLAQYIKRKRPSKGTRGGLSEHFVRHFLKQLADALKFLRSHNLVHRDIKPQNLLLIPPNDQDDIPLLKVADFGFARNLPNASLADTMCGSPLYMGPEILSGLKYDAKADLWSVGAVLYEVVTGRPPFRAQNHIELLKKINENEDRIRFPDEKADAAVAPIGNDIKDLIRKLLKKNPVERISFEEFFMHPAITNSPPSPPSSSSSPPPPPRPSSSSSRSTTNTTRHRRMSHDIPRSPIHHDTSYEPPPFAQSPPQQPPPTPPTTMAHATPPHSRPYTDWKRHTDQQRPHSRTRYDDRLSTTPRSADQHNTWMDDTQRRNQPARTDEDVLNDYVVLDRRIIETNQFADELGASPRTELHSNNNNTLTTTHQRHIPIPRRTSTEQPLPSPSSTGSTPPYAVTRERKVSSGSAGSALARALSMASMASVRLFGAGNSPPKLSRLHQHTMSGSPRGFLTMDGNQGVMDAQERQTMKTIERAACMAHAVACFADGKYDQLVQGRLSSNEALVAEEAMVLYIKSLSLLELGMNTARHYWNQLLDDTTRIASVRLNDAVQWMRERFNECLDRASFAGSKCHGDSQITPGACVEKLLYDRALEMSRAAAVYELVGENIPGCEHDYQTAIWMLEAILEVTPDDDTQIEEDDRRIINKFIDSIRSRITVLRKKKDLERAKALDSGMHQYDQYQ
ncbi:serine threonine protein kinase [Lichtheimia corymbifera JMRC:FSU:9682]|uniref:non-specific serine/threonine protein kinase n=1 Tax=Lichtheimia corymbifera JMRC:FSU:9682 TaxID=1263082 RepID=A0A068RXX9_9FUNG|nr:serine threonine protein kinase [Lichtheimia corymbifera JMRC:FSU:9682]